MHNQQSNLPPRKSYLSPEYLKSVRKIQSPKFDQQKAQQDQLQRKIIYEQKLARYGEYNSMLSAKAKKELDSLRTQLQSDNKKVTDVRKNQPVTIQAQKSTKSKLQKPSDNINFVVPKQQNNKQNLQLLRGKNRALNTKNTELKTYLKQLNTGVSELECILEEVEVTCASLKNINPNLKGLWILQEEDEHQDFIKSEKNTKDTVDLDWEGKTQFFIRHQQNTKSPLTKNIAKRQAKFPDEKLFTLHQLETKFKKVLQKISKRQMQGAKIDQEANQLSAIERQLDQLKNFYTGKTLNNCESHKNIPPYLPYHQKGLQLAKNQTLSKVKSLGSILS